MSRQVQPGLWNPASLRPFNADLTLGAVEIGVLVSTFLFGVVTVQCYVYAFRFPKDPLFLKFLVPFVWLLELAHTICICQALYVVTIRQYGRPQLLDIPPQSLNVAILFSGFIGPIEQGWFSHRIYKFSGQMYLPLFCASLAVTRWFMSTALAIVAFHRLTVEQYIQKWCWLLSSILVIGAISDAILALALCYYLSQWRHTAFKRTTRLLDRLMLWSIETGLLTCIGAVALLACLCPTPSFGSEFFLYLLVYSLIPSSHRQSLSSFPNMYPHIPLTSSFGKFYPTRLNARPTLAQIYQEDTIHISLGPSEPEVVTPTSPSHPALELGLGSVACSHRTSGVPGRSSVQLSTAAAAASAPPYVQKASALDEEKGVQPPPISADNSPPAATENLLIINNG
ncbi:hypothetical protein D9613_004339 [Agrocybe pediades]|uniref:DUF6534 domain-containing protein n=1 Tax=Agrocybe pediades TaxID=84607 RepID=A0A8H4VIX0_9AGAR|nr:hypothetical protein D9613_004339 [Agrocybe pediades]